MAVVLGALGITGAGVAGGFFSTIGGRLLASVAIGALQYVIQKNLAASAQSDGSITTDQVLTGEVNPIFWQMGTYATAGMAACPELTHGDDKYLTYVIVVSSMKKVQLKRLMINGAYATISETSPHADYGKRIVGSFESSEEQITGTDVYGTPIVSTVIDNFAWIKWYDGTQTVADPMLLAKYGAHATWPWSSDMIGRDLTYAILTFKANSDVFSAKPTVMFEVYGIPLYNPAKDSTVGGVGTHRWNDQNTWEASDNPIVQAYNVMRGITFAIGKTWGGSFAEADLPTANMIAAINACNVLDASNNPMYRSGIEVNVLDEPASVMEEISKAAAAEWAEIGGIWETNVGDAPLPEYFITDDDLVVTADRTTDLFNGDLNRNIFNGAVGTYPEPLIAWESKSSPLVEFTDYRTADLGKPLVADIDFSTVPYPDQVQRLCSSYVKDSRRMRRHDQVMPPVSAFLKPLRTLSWTSTDNSYSAKVFKIEEIRDDLLSMVQGLSIRETDPTDYDPVTVTPTVTVPGVPQPTSKPSVVGFAVAPYTLYDADATARKPAVRLSWSTLNISPSVQSIEWEARVIGTTPILIRGSTTNVTAGSFIEQSVAARTTYEFRSRFKTTQGFGPWTAWLSVTAPNVTLQSNDLGQSVYDEMSAIAAEVGITTVSVLPASGTPNQIVMLLPPGQLYRWTGTVWTTDIYAEPAAGSVDITSFASGIEPVGISTSPTLPTVKTTESIIWQGKLYRWNGSAYVATVPTTDLTGTISAAQITAGAVNASHIAADAVTAGAIAAGAVSTSELAAGAITASKIAISDTANLYPDFDMLDLSFYSTDTAAVYSLTSLANTLHGLQGLRVAVSAAIEDVYSNWIICEPSTEYLITIGAWLTSGAAGSGTVIASIQTGTMDTAGVITPSTTTQIISRTDSTVGTPSQISITTGASDRRIRFRFRRSAGGNAEARFAGPKIQKKAGGSLIVDGSITTTKLAAGSVMTNELAANAVVASKISAGTITGDKLAATSIITSSGQIDDLTVTTLKIDGNAVTVPVRATSPAVYTLSNAFSKVISAKITREGYPTDIMVGLTVTGFNLDGTFVDSFFMRVRIKRGGTVIREWYVQVASVKDFPIALFMTDSDVGTGSTVYTVEAFDPHSRLTVKSPNLSLTQLKR